MAKGKKFTLKVKRKREVKTDYKQRLKLLLSNKPRLVIRKSLNNILLQIIKYEEKGDKVLLSSHSRELKKLGWPFHLGNIPSAYLTGFLLGKKAKNIKEAILDIGLQKSIKGSRIYAALKGATDAGLNISHNKKIFPTEERIKGLHTKKQDIEKKFEEIKEKIEHG